MANPRNEALTWSLVALGLTPRRVKKSCFLMSSKRPSICAASCSSAWVAGAGVIELPVPAKALCTPDDEEPPPRPEGELPKPSRGGMVFKLSIARLSSFWRRSLASSLVPGSVAAAFASAEPGSVGRSSEETSSASMIVSS